MAKRILVVEEGVDCGQWVVAVLKQVCGYETVEAANGKEAVEMAVSEKPDLILMDVDLPDISGIDAARAVKSNPRTAHIPIIAQTGWASKQWKTAAVSGGNGGLSSKAGVIGLDNIHDRGIHTA